MQYSSFLQVQIGVDRSEHYHKEVISLLEDIGDPYDVRGEARPAGIVGWTVRSGFQLSSIEGPESGRYITGSVRHTCTAFRDCRDIYRWRSPTCMEAPTAAAPDLTHTVLLGRFAR